MIGLIKIESSTSWAEVLMETGVRVTELNYNEHTKELEPSVFNRFK